MRLARLGHGRVAAANVAAALDAVGPRLRRTVSLIRVLVALVAVYLVLVLAAVVLS